MIFKQSNRSTIFQGRKIQNNHSLIIKSNIQSVIANKSRINQKQQENKFPQQLNQNQSLISQIFNKKRNLVTQFEKSKQSKTKFIQLHTQQNSKINNDNSVYINKQLNKSMHLKLNQNTVKVISMQIQKNKPKLTYKTPMNAFAPDISISASIINKSSQRYKKSKSKSKSKTKKRKIIQNTQSKPNIKKIIISQRKFNTSKLNVDSERDRQNCEYTNQKQQRKKSIKVSSLIKKKQNQKKIQKSKLQNIDKQLSKMKKKKKKKVLISQTIPINVRQFIALQNQQDYDSEYLKQKYKNDSFQKICILSKVKKMQDQLKQKKLKETQKCAAIKIQKIFRGYRVRKQFMEYKKIIKAVITIQRFFRGYQSRKQYAYFKHKYSLPISLNYQNNKKNRLQQLKLQCTQILQKPNFIISQDTLNKQYLNLPRKIDDKMQIQCPHKLLQKLPNLQHLHKQKLIHNTNMKKQQLKNLMQQKLYSPKSHQIKNKQLDQRLKFEIQKFQKNIKQVIRSWQSSNQDVYLMSSELEYKKDVQHRGQQNKRIIEAFKNIDACQQRVEKTLTQQSQQVLNYLALTNFQDLKFDSSLIFIQQYLNDLFEFLSKRKKWKKWFLVQMNTPNNFSKTSILKTLNIFKQNIYSEQSQQQNKQQILISNQIVLQFNQKFKKLKRHISPKPPSYQLQQIYVQLIIKVLNQQLNKQKTHSSLLMHYYLFKTQQNIHDTLKNNPNFSQQQIKFNNYFALSYDQIYNHATQLCGFIEDNKQIQANYLKMVHECRLNQMLNKQIENELKKSLMNEIYLQIDIKLEVSDLILLNIIDEFITEFQLI